MKRASSPLTICMNAAKSSETLQRFRRNPAKTFNECCPEAEATHGNSHATFCHNYSELHAHLDGCAAKPHQIESDEDVDQCVDCGAFAPKGKTIAHHKGCVPGESDGWATHYGSEGNLPAPGSPSQISKAQDALTFIFAGNALFTLRSKKTGTRYTYKVQMSHDDASKPPVWFVRLLSGPDNTNDYQYLGMIKDGKFRLTAKSRMTASSVPVVAITWTLDRLNKGVFHDLLEMWHEGRCGRCGRTLTVPESIERGIGPECAQKMGGFLR